MADDTQVLIDVESLSPNPLQPRGQILLDSIDDLVISIKQHGVLEPLVIAETPAGMQIIAGERRWRAAKELGIKKVPAIVKKTTPQGMLEMAIVENVQRTNLNTVERGNAYRRLVEDFNMMVGEVAKRIGKSISYVSNSLRILDLPDSVKDGLISGDISEGHAKALTGLEDKYLINEAFKEILRKNLSVRQTEEMVRKMKEKSAPQINLKNEKKNKFVIHEKLDSMVRDIEKKVNAKCRIVRSTRSTKLLIVIPGKYEETEEKFLSICEKLVRE
jgi:ParB family transcriptional regulator, chromosome partitioning protein